MSSDIEILDDEEGQWVNLTIRSGGCIELDICVPQFGGPVGEATVRFDLHKKDHAEAIKKLISHLQHQLVDNDEEYKDLVRRMGWKWNET